MADFSKTFTDETEELYNSPTPWSPFPIPENLIFSRANENQLEPSHQVKNIETLKGIIHKNKRYLLIISKSFIGLFNIG